MTLVTARTVLGVYPGDDLSEIKARYRLLASQAHPDKGGDREEFERIHEAYLALQPDSLVDADGRVLVKGHRRSPASGVSVAA